MSLKNAREWAEDERLHGITREDAAAVACAIQIDALEHASELCRQRIAQIKNEAHNIACTECAVTIKAEAYRLKDHPCLS